MKGPWQEEVGIVRYHIVPQIEVNERLSLELECFDPPTLPKTPVGQADWLPVSSYPFRRKSAAGASRATAE
jgi:hypothetical protein